ncbi:MAG: CRTAC1 family protein [Planctomycetes bacterium]|nr:CRTAC1 family protein [Planctomycetota bacterium]
MVPPEQKSAWVDPGQAGARQAVAVPQISWTDMTASLPGKFSHVSGAMGAKLLPETMGAGVVVLDANSDGQQDILLLDSCPWPGQPAQGGCQLFLNRGGWKFDNVSAEWGLGAPLYALGGCAGDLDNDGHVDLVITAVGGNHVFRNDGGQRFVDVTARSGLTEAPGSAWPDKADGFSKISNPLHFPASATLLDYDSDGLPDIFVCSYVTWAPGIDLGVASTLTGDKRGYVSPKSFEGSACRLYRNTGGMGFVDVSEQAGIAVRESEGVGPMARTRGVAKSLGVVACDPDDDGWPDLLVANDTVRNFFFHNESNGKGGRIFREIGLNQGAAYADGVARAGMGIDWGEYLPGKRAAVIANFANEPLTFLVADPGPPPRFSDRALAVGLAGPSRVPMKFGLNFVDVDLDGALDLLVCNGHLEPDIALVQASQAFAQAPQIFWNSGSQPRCFEPMPAFAGNDSLMAPLVGRGCAHADFDGDGDLDLILTSNGGPCRLLRNDQSLKHHWASLSLKGNRNNRSAIGAVVRLTAGGITRERAVTAGRGYLSQSELPLTFGLGASTTIDRVEVRWPGAKTFVPITTPAIDTRAQVQE